jgi:hypothetical protein
MPRDRAAIYQRDREEERARSRAYYAANRDRLKARARARAAARREDIRAYQKEWTRQDRVKRRALYLWRTAKIRAVKRGLEFTIELADVVIPAVCPVLGIPIVVESGQSVQPGAPSLDRIDNSGGYTRENTRVISHRANALKRDGTREELRLVLANWTAR